MSELQLFPLGTTRGEDGELMIEGASVTDLVNQFGTPLYIYSENTLRAACRSYTQPIDDIYPNSTVMFAAKSYLDPTIAKIVGEEGLGVETVSGSEMQTVHRAGIPPELITLHGNNKLTDEIDQAVDLGIGHLVADGTDDLQLIAERAHRSNRTANILLRLTPGISAHTHEYIRTGEIDSKFGIPIANGQAADAVRMALNLPGIKLIGYHAHIGSQIFDVNPFKGNVKALIDFSIQMEAETGYFPEAISPGGGAGVRYEEQDSGLSPESLVKEICHSLIDYLPDKRRPHLILEPGRSIIARSGIAVYTVGTIKRIPEVRTYVAVDGGMADNIRPALYGANYTVVLANRDTSGGPTETVSVAGRYCESGDILFNNITLPKLNRGDLLASATSGAYGMSMASNYNMALRPAVVMVDKRKARLTRRRETINDIWNVFPAED